MELENKPKRRQKKAKRPHENSVANEPRERTPQKTPEIRWIGSERNGTPKKN
jgi:hypothetical protein